jgi:hypothetical protein
MSHDEQVNLERLGADYSRKLLRDRKRSRTGTPVSRMRAIDQYFPVTFDGQDAIAIYFRAHIEQIYLHVPLPTGRCRPLIISC